MPLCSRCGRARPTTSTPSAHQPAAIEWVVKVNGEVEFRSASKSEADGYAAAYGGIVRAREVT